MSHWCWALCWQSKVQQDSQLLYMRQTMKAKDRQVEELTVKWHEFQHMKDEWAAYERGRIGEKDLVRKQTEQIAALKNKVC